MARYEYRCRTCDEVFEVRRSMSEAPATVPCPQGHADTVKLLSAFASVGAASSGSTGAAAGPCGGSCACYPG
ncbi:MAG TPA: zinc ribbon domain-containing protein [Acidimicrobiales bacterium]